MVANNIKGRFSGELKAFGAHLKALRIRHKLTQEQLAHDAGISFNSINRIEAGVLNPSFATLLGIASALKIHPKILMEFKK